MGALLSLILVTVTMGTVASVPVAGIHALKTRLHLRQDKLRRYYYVRFPKDFSFEQVLAFIWALNGIRPKEPVFPHAFGLHLVAPPTLVFELEADETGIRYRLGVPIHYADYVIGQLRSHIPGVRVEPDAEGMDTTWGYCVELTTTNDQAPFRIGSSEAVIKSLLAATHPLKEGQAILIQYVMCPADPERPRDADKLHKEKQADHTFLVVARLGANAENLDEAKRLVRRVLSALGSISAYGVRFTERRGWPRAIHNRLFSRTSPAVFPPRRTQRKWQHLSLTQRATPVLLDFRVGDQGTSRLTTAFPLRGSSSGLPTSLEPRDLSPFLRWTG